jgi:predicted secreted protein with PEFG-CTERM motif
MSLILLAASAVPLSFAWDGSMAMDADKRNVERGQIITYEGYLYGEYPIDDELVFITVLEKDTKKIILTAQTAPETKSVEYFENTAWSFSFQVGTSYQEFSADRTYVVEAMYDDQSTKLEFFIQPGPEPTCLDLLGGDDVMVFTDKEKYDQGDAIEISGCLSENAFTKGINIAVYDPEGTKIGVSTIVPSSDRTFSDEFIIDEKFGLEGTYFVEADAGGLYSSTKSFVVPEFGAIATVVMFVAVASVVLMSSKYAKIMPKL